MKSTGPSPAVRQLVIERADWLCLRCRNARGEVLHHRRPRKAGGTSRPEINSPENCVWICNPCHLDIESNREAAEATGWIVPEGVDGPLEISLVDLRGNQFHLLDTGAVSYLFSIRGFYPSDPADWVPPWSAA